MTQHSDPTWPTDVDFQRAAPVLAKVRMIVTSLTMGIFLVASIVLTILVSNWWGIAIAGVLILWVWLLWLIPRQVRCLAWGESKEEFIIRKGILFRNLTVIPYGRIQYVDVNEGPIARRYGIATITLHTASVSTSGAIEGVPAEEAARLRDSLAERGGTEMAGL